MAAGRLWGAVSSAARNTFISDTAGSRVDGTSCNTSVSLEGRYGALNGAAGAAVFVPVVFASAVAVAYAVPGRAANFARAIPRAYAHNRSAAFRRARARMNGRP